MTSTTHERHAVTRKKSLLLVFRHLLGDIDGGSGSSVALAACLCVLFLCACAGSPSRSSRRFDDGFRQKLTTGCDSSDECERLVFEARFRLRHCAADEESPGDVLCSDARADLSWAENIEYEYTKQLWGDRKSKAAAQRAEEEAAKVEEERAQAEVEEDRRKKEREARAAREAAAEVARREAAVRQEAEEKARLEEERKQEAIQRSSTCAARRQTKCNADCQGNQACVGKCIQKALPCN